LSLADFDELKSFVKSNLPQNGDRRASFICFRSTYHFGCWVDNFHLLENSSTIVGDQDLAFGVLDLKVLVGGSFWTYHLVHTAGAEGSADNICDS
jgi:hypothetical protein